MGCIMPPMPNHLSTCLSLPLNHKTTHKRVGKKGRKKKRAVWKQHQQGCGGEKRGVWDGATQRSVEIIPTRSSVDKRKVWKRRKMDIGVYP